MFSSGGDRDQNRAKRIKVWMTLWGMMNNRDKEFMNEN